VAPAGGQILELQAKAPATRAKGVKKSVESAAKLDISKPLTVILNLTQRGEAVQAG
jgi:hypothetical protein